MLFTIRFIYTVFLTYMSTNYFICVDTNLLHMYPSLTYMLSLCMPYLSILQISRFLHCLLASGAHNNKPYAFDLFHYAITNCIPFYITCLYKVCHFNTGNTQNLFLMPYSFMHSKQSSLCKHLYTCHNHVINLCLYFCFQYFHVSLFQTHPYKP